MEHRTRKRRRHSRELKAKVLAACERPGASVAAVALAHGLNANLVHKWRRTPTLLPVLRATQSAGEFIAVPVPQPVPGAGSDIRIELRRGTTAVKVSWPLAGAADCAAWLQHLLK